MLPHSVLKPVVIGKTITDSGTWKFSDGFPIGPAYRRLLIDLHFTIAHTASTLVDALGDLRYLRGLNFYDDRGNMYVKNLQGTALYRRNQFLGKTAARRTNIAASSATYSTLIIVDFSDPCTLEYDATIVDTQDCRQMTLEANFGALTDLVTAGSDTLSVTGDVYVDCTKSPVPQGSVKFIQQLSGLPTVDPGAVTSIDIPKVKNEYLKRLHVLTTNSAGAYPFSGTATANTLARLYYQANQEYEYNNALVGLITGVNKTDYQQETWPTGWHVLDFIKGGSLAEAPHTNDYSTLQLQWLADTTSTSQVSVLQERLVERK